MTITIPPELEKQLVEYARRNGKTPEQCALDLIRVVAPPKSKLTPEEELALLRSMGVDTGVALTDEQTSRECLYD